MMSYWVTIVLTLSSSTAIARNPLTGMSNSVGSVTVPINLTSALTGARHGRRSRIQEAAEHSREYPDLGAGASAATLAHSQHRLAVLGEDCDTPRAPRGH